MLEYQPDNLGSLPDSELIEDLLEDRFDRTF